MNQIILRKDKMSFWAKERAQAQLHPECFWKISISPALSPLEVGCKECRTKYKKIATFNPITQKKVALTKPEKLPTTNWFEFEGKRTGMKKFLYFRNTELERKNALLEKENEDLKVLVEELKKRDSK